VSFRLLFVWFVSKILKYATANKKARQENLPGFHVQFDIDV